MSYFKRILTAVTALAMLASLALPAAAVKEVPVQITPGQTVIPDLTNEECTLTFTPEADGWYGFYSTGHGTDPSANVWCEEFEINNDDGGEDLNFLIKQYFTAGQTYRFYAEWGLSRDAQLALHLEPLVKAEAMTLAAEALSDYAGESYFMECDFQPMLAAPEDVTWESSNEAVASVDLNGNIDLLAPGKATVTATSESGLTASAEVTVPEVQELTDGDSVALTGEQDSVRFRFVPETTGWYYFYSTDAQTVPDGFVMDEYGDWLNANCGGLDGRNFLMCVYLLAGHAYYLEADPCGGSLNVHLKKAVAPAQLLLSRDSLKGNPDMEYSLDASFMPELSYQEEVTWQSSDEAVATVDPYGNVTLVSPGTAIITATSESGLTAQCPVTVKGPEPLACGAPVRLDPLEGAAWFSFTPETDGWYRFFSQGEGVDPYAYIYNEDKSQCLVFSDDSNDMHFNASCEMTAGETYLLYVDFYVGEGICTVELQKQVPATGLTLSKTRITADLYSYDTLEAIPVPDNAICEEVTWTSSNDAVVYVNDGDLYMEGVGTATVTASTASGLTASCTVTVREPATLVCDEPQTCGGENHRSAFRFIPGEDGWYGFWSAGEADPNAELYEGSSYMDWDDDNGTDYNFLLRTQLEAGKCYTLVVGPAGIETEYTVAVTKLREPQQILLRSERYWSYEGDYVDLSDYRLLPYPSLDTEVTWTTSDLAVADVYWGNVNCINPGTAQITVTTENGLSASAEITVFEIPADAEYYGRCGDTLLYTVTDGILTVTGTGEMSDNWGWERCEQAILPEGVTKIGNYNFSYSDLTGITVPSTVEQIGARAFAWSSLSEIRFLGSAPEIGPGVFEELTVTAYYPANDPSWTEAVMADYGGSVTWVPYGAEQGVTVSGTVTAFSGADATLELRQGSDVIVSMVLPGKADGYTLLGILPGSYTLTVSKEGHVTRTYAITVAGEAVTLDVKLHLPGDVTGDGKVNVADTSKTYAHARQTGLITDEYLLACADITGDGKVNVADTSKLYALARK